MLWASPKTYSSCFEAALCMQSPNVVLLALHWGILVKLKVELSVGSKLFADTRIYFCRLKIQYFTSHVSLQVRLLLQAAKVHILLGSAIQIADCFLHNSFSSMFSAFQGQFSYQKEVLKQQISCSLWDRMTLAMPEDILLLKFQASILSKNEILNWILVHNKTARKWNCIFPLFCQQ